MTNLAQGLGAALVLATMLAVREWRYRRWDGRLPPGITERSRDGFSA